MWEKYLREQVLWHPSMEPLDVMKFCYQAAFGAEHLLRDKAAAWRYLQAEYENISAEEIVMTRNFGNGIEEPLYECISDTLCRVNLRAWKKRELPLEWLFAMFVKGAEYAAKDAVKDTKTAKDAEAAKNDLKNVASKVSGEFAGEENPVGAAFVTMLQEAETLIREGIFGFGEEIWQEYLKNYPLTEPVAVHHSESYREAEKPVYRLVQRKYIRLSPILEALSEAGFRAVKAGQDTNVGQNHNAEQGMEAKDTSESGVVDDESYVIAIDGRCASGKTTMAQMLAELTGAGVVHMDDFFLPMELRTPERLQEPGGNVHYERVLEEVLPYISKTEGFSYGRFDCGQMGIAGRRFVEAGNLRIVEGAYSCHPKLGDYMSLRVFSDVDASVQLERIKDRDGENALKAYRERWIPMEEAYLETYDIRVMADIVL